MEYVTRQECVRLAVALALGALVASPPPAAAQVPLTCIAQAGSVSFRFEPAVFDGGPSAWSLLSVSADPFFYESGGFDRVVVLGGGSVRLRDKKGIDRTEPAPGQADVKARLTATVVGTVPDFDIQLALQDKDSGRTVTLDAHGSCLK